MSHSNLPHDFATEAAKGLPPVAVTAAQLTGSVDWETWVFILTAAYLALQIGWLLWRYADKIMGKNDRP